jgi:hypothetical protein
MSEGVPQAIRRLVRERAVFCCEYCFSPLDYSPDPFCIEHIWPRAHLGSNAPENLAYSCLGCNNRKFVATDGIDPMSGELAALFHPRRDRWEDHFAWESDDTLIVGISPTGRATVARLDLNRPGVVNLRRVLRQSGISPAKPKQ